MTDTNQQPESVSLQDALALAVSLHREGNYADAATLYQRILEGHPDQPDALHFMGLLARQQGRSDEALQYMRKAVAVAPDYASAHNNLGNLLLERRDYPAARVSLEEALRLHPDDSVILNNIGIAIRNTGDAEGARATFERALALAPEFALPYENLGYYYYRRGDIASAHDHFCKAVVRDPTLSISNTFLGMALARLGRVDDARAHYLKWAEMEPENPIPKHMYGTVSGEPPPPRASDDYVRNVFDNFASSFDQQLHKLEYRAPELVAAAVRDIAAGRSGGLDIMDAGCGTGLCGPLLRPWARRIEGVDLSSKMLERARTTGSYDALVESELTAHLAASRNAFDLVVSADTLCYFGDLADVCGAAKGALRGGGIFIFTVEAHDGALAGREGALAVGYALGESGRYRHTRSYVTRIVTGSGFEEPRVVEEILRREGGVPVNGFLVVAKRA